MDFIDKLVMQCCEILEKSKTEEEQRYWISANIFQINIKYPNSDINELKSQRRIFLEKLKLQLQETGLYERGNLEKIIDDCMMIFA